MTPLEALATAGIKVDPSCEIDRDENGCAIWPFGKTAAGYGMYYPAPRVPEYVHRTVCAAVNGPVPDGWHVDHVWERGCRSRACFWPDHLEAVTREENARRAGLAIRQRRARLCGHPWEAGRPGRPDCAICHRESQARRQAAKPNPAHDRVRLMRQLLADGFSDREIASQVGVSSATVGRVRRGESYAYVR